MPKRPNIIVCIADQLRAFELGCYGNQYIRTPYLDQLAAEGVRFEVAMSNAPVCMAARSVLLSGQYNRTCTGGVSNVSFPGRPGEFNMPEYPEAGRPHLPDLTLPESLRDIGYDTAVIGKWHIHSWPQDIGFNHFLIPRVHHCYSNQHYTEDGGPEFVPAGYSVDFEADRVVEFLQTRSKDDDPFFLYYSISPPHCPLSDAPEHYLTMYDPALIPLRPNVDLRVPLQNWDYWRKVYRWDFRYYSHHLPYTEELPANYDLRQLIAEYYGLTSWVDDCVGRMLETLAHTGLDEETIVIFTADHGDNLGSHGRVMKGNPHEESARIPLLVCGPQISPTVARNQVTSLVDLYPTLLDLVGAPIPLTVHGQSVAPVVRGEQTELANNNAIIEPCSGYGAAVRTPSHLYNLPRGEDGTGLATTPEDFFDLHEDPYQLHNLAGGTEQTEVAHALNTLLHEWDVRTPWLNSVPIPR